MYQPQLLSFAAHPDRVYRIEARCVHQPSFEAVAAPMPVPSVTGSTTRLTDARLHPQVPSHPHLLQLPELHAARFAADVARGPAHLPGLGLQPLQGQ